MISDDDEPESGADEAERADGKRRFEGAISSLLKRAVEKAVEPIDKRVRAVERKNPPKEPTP